MISEAYNPKDTAMRDRSPGETARPHRTLDDMVNELHKIVAAQASEISALYRLETDTHKILGMSPDARPVSAETKDLGDMASLLIALSNQHSERQFIYRSLSQVICSPKAAACEPADGRSERR